MSEAKWIETPGWIDDHDVEFSDLVGNTLVSVEQGSARDGDALEFTTTGGDRYVMWHRQSCCEDVNLNEIVGELGDLVGARIESAEETSNSGDVVGDEFGSTETWTFYTIRTIKGTVMLRWYGSSNGYYSESVSFAKMVEGSYK